MSTYSCPTGWKNPRRFSVFLPEDVRHIDPMRPALECSATHAVLAFDDHVYIYSLSTFDLIHILNPGKLAIVGPIRIYGKTLIITCNLHGSQQSTEYWSLYIWDLSAGRHIGNVQFYGQIVKYEISVTQLGTAEAMDDCNLVDRKWVEDPILITTSKPDRGKEAKLRAYILHCTGGASTEGPLEGDQEPPTRYMAPATTIPIRPASCVASLERTAITGGWDATVRVHDFITGECQLVLMGHTNLVCDVGLDEKRIYSLSYDSTVRIWDCLGGDCLHVLDNPVFENGGSRFLPLDTPYLHLITICAHPPSPTIRIWDPLSGKLVQEIHSNLGCDLGPTGRQERTLITRAINTSLTSDCDCVNIWSLKTGQLLATVPTEPVNWHSLPWHFRDKYLIIVDKQDEQYLLEIWDFGIEEESIEINDRVHLQHNTLDDLD